MVNIQNKILFGFIQIYSIACEKGLNSDVEYLIQNSNLDAKNKSIQTIFKYLVSLEKYIFNTYFRSNNYS
jgi:hypothetical protein